MRNRYLIPTFHNNNLPPKCYYRLPEAAEIIGCSVDDLVHYGATGRIELVTPLPADLYVISVHRKTGEVDPPFISPELLVVGQHQLQKIELLGSANASNFNAGYELWNETTDRVTAYWHLSDEEKDSTGPNYWSFLLSESWNTAEVTKSIKVTTENLWIVCYEIKRFISGDILTPAQDVENRDEREEYRNKAMANDRRSNKLVFLNQAFTKFWANADPTDKTTHPDGDAIQEWFKEKGFGQTLAEKAATIIRPEWGAIGRRPEK